MSTNAVLPLGKIPNDLLSALLQRAPVSDPRVIRGPGIGLDCAVIDLGERILVFKTDPITFATEEIGWYAVQVNANDIATTGAIPRWMLVTLLLPEGRMSIDSVDAIFEQIYQAAATMGISVVGGHTEITYDLRRPIINGTMIGEVARDQLVTPDQAQPGDRLLLTKGVPIEATAILAREFSAKMQTAFTAEELAQAQNYLYQPGISVLRDAQTAIRAGRVHAMHDPTEGGLAGALHELAQACGHQLVIDPASVYQPDLARRACALFGIDPLAAIASGALLIAAPAESANAIQNTLIQEGIACSEIGYFTAGQTGVVTGSGAALPRPARDEIARLFESPGA